MSDDIPEIENSEAAYLLDPQFRATEDNVLQCIDDFFNAPGLLYYEYTDWEEPADRESADFDIFLYGIKKPEGKRQFAQVFDTVSIRLLPDGEALLENQDHGYPEDLGEVQERVSFQNRIAEMTVYQFADFDVITFENWSAFDVDLAESGEPVTFNVFYTDSRVTDALSQMVRTNRPKGSRRIRDLDQWMH